MTYKTHVAFSMLVSMPIAFSLYSTTNHQAYLFLGASAFASLVPDLDEEGSYLSRKLPIFPIIFKLFGVTHRGITHRLISVFLLIILFLALENFNETSFDTKPLIYGFVLGYFMHLAGDLLTKGGINQFFYPFSKAKGVLLPRRFRFYTNSATELFVFLGIMSMIMLELYYFGVFNGKFL